jgi:hypothetical protein
MVLCKTCEAFNGELKFFKKKLCVINLNGGIMKTDLCNLFGLRVYVIKCNMGLGLLWKFNVVLGLCGLKNLRKEGRQVGSRERER